MPKHEYFDVDVGERIATVTINRPEARNALTAAMRRDFGVLMPALGEDHEVAVVVLTGADPAFCSGVDLKDRLADGTVPPRVEPNPAAVLRSMPIPVIAAVNGACVTGGLEMALSCSFVLASDREGLSVSLIEALTYSVPAVASDVGGNGELLGDGCGLLVPADDADGTAE